MIRHFVGKHDPSWRFTMTAVKGGYKQQTLSRGAEYLHELRGHVERNRHPLPGIVRDLALLEDGKPLAPEFREKQWLTEWLKAGLIREVQP